MGYGPLSDNDWSLKRKPDAAVSLSLATMVHKQLQLFAVTTMQSLSAQQSHSVRSSVQ